ncbi:hypothetical protein ACEPAH_4289 [Sanghuangporus vaninii]
MIKHPDFWFDDGSVLIIAEDEMYRLHRSLITRLSPSFFDRCCQLASVPEECRIDPDLCLLPCFAIRAESNISKDDLSLLIAYILHDIVLTDDSPFRTVLQLYIVSSKEGGDFKKIHDVADKQLSAIMQKNPLELDFSHHDLLDRAFNISKANDNSQLEVLLKRALYYSLATRDDSGDVGRLEPGLSARDIEGSDPTDIGERIMAQLSDHFSPTLFQPPAVLHMQCTDVYATLWMERAVGPAFDDNGTANPFMTLRRLRDLDWKRETHELDGERSEPCAECLEHMRQQWSDEAQAIWGMMDRWLVE